ncbi:MAG: response regulator [Steroidobacteraceae bacterium]|nr:response regulator [Steroidobacteraceae bacterium]
MSVADARNAGAGTRVLIAEDSATQAELLAHVLQINGYRVTRAANGKLAFEMALRQKPDLVISDVIMPEMNGYELCAAIKQHPTLLDVPVILVTTLSDPRDVIRGLECRADNFILKPYDANDLLHHVQFVLVNRQMRQNERQGKGIEIMFGGQKHSITADGLQILNLLLTTYEAAIQRNRELSTTRDTLNETNKELQRLTHELEDRVRKRTRELEQSNEALRQAQHALIQQERLRALGQMASGIAHDINNAISPISLYTEAMLEREPTLSDRARGYLKTIQRAVDDVAQTVGRLREFYRPREQELQLADVELNPLIQQVVDLTRARWNDLAQQRGIMIELQTEFANDLVTIRGAENEIRDALTNLIFNAVDALPQGGKILIRTRTQTLPNPHGGNEPCAVIEVVDNGVGMDEETRRRCLEPFFTTKGDRGTGLGLAMVYGMAKRHSAGLDLESAVGLGTTIRLVFRGGTQTTSATSRNPSPLFATRSLRVLLVDDDPSLLESLRTALEDEGHKVVTASGGQSGIDAFRESQKAHRLFDIVITDLGMPYVDGRQVVASIRSMSPGTPIILLTGWGQHVANESEKAPPVDRLLGKPPRIRELRTALAELTGRRATDRVG